MKEKRGTRNGKYSSMVFSIIYLSQEIRKHGLPKTADRIESAIDTFFCDLAKMDELDKDMQQLQELLGKVLGLSHQEISAFLSYASSVEARRFN